MADPVTREQLDHWRETNKKLLAGGGVFVSEPDLQDGMYRRFRIELPSQESVIAVDELLRSVPVLIAEVERLQAQIDAAPDSISQALGIDTTDPGFIAARMEMRSILMRNKNELERETFRLDDENEELRTRLAAVEALCDQAETYPRGTCRDGSPFPVLIDAASVRAALRGEGKP